MTMDFHRPSTPARQVPPEEPIRAAELPVAVKRFSERLRHLPLGVWAELSERIDYVREADLTSYAEDHNAVAAARARLRQVADGMPNAVTRVRGRVLELVSCAEGFFRPDTLRRMKKVALTAAIALTARPQLAQEEFDRLYEPFAGVIPLEDLVVNPASAVQGERPVVS
jgi:hypothetical protein